jgi:hypothetical protein
MVYGYQISVANQTILHSTESFLVNSFGRKSTAMKEILVCEVKGNLSSLGLTSLLFNLWAIFCIGYRVLRLPYFYCQAHHLHSVESFLGDV